ncbi:MAG: hypothetical protein GAK35_03407 [Herbaspirillum frisingense]|uniref:Uncharacterized protein n=1 Tax=Herbaspirillum frisingense TaxID=92645 RepID=A0A7V8FUB7_9BURK|nr:MAG: hypothetical protein GAK35_03407 [Herbaspirillum frisingense]
MPNMRAKLVLQKIEQFEAIENLHFSAVAAKSYPTDGSDENNTYAKFSPSASLVMTVMNPELLGKFKAGESYYVDFTPAE